jgi:hypothetical protein
VRRHGGALALVAVAWAAVVFGLVMPWIRAGVGVQTDGYYAWLGGPVGLLTAPFTRPAEILNALDRPAPWFVVAGLVVGVLGLPLVRPRWLILVAPPLAALLLSAHSFQAGLRLQYPLILVTPLLAATAFGGRRVLAVLERGRRRWRRRRRQASVSAAWPGRPGLPRRAGFAVGLVFALAAAPGLSDAWVQGSIPPFDDGDPAFVDRPSSIDRLWTVGAAVPRDASLVADEGLLAPLAGRTSIGRLVGPPDPEAFVLLDRQAWFPTGLARTRHERAMKALPASGRPLLADDGRFVLYGPVGGSSP